MASATRDDTRLLSVVLASHDRWADSAALLDYGFNNFRVARLAQAGETLLELPCKGAIQKKVPVIAKTDLLCCVPRDSTGLDLRFELPEKVGPCRGGTVIGRAIVFQEGRGGEGRPRDRRPGAPQTPASPWQEQHCGLPAAPRMKVFATYPFELGRVSPPRGSCRSAGYERR